MPEHQQIQQSKKTNTSFQKQATPVIQTPLSNPYSIIQRAKINPNSLTHADIMQLQRTIGNRAVGRLLSGIGNTSTAQQVTVQRQEIPEEEEKPIQGKFETMQRLEIPEEEEPLQGKMVGTVQRQEIPEEEPPMQGKFKSIQRQEIPQKGEKCPSCIQKQETPEEEEPLQGKMIRAIQRQEIPEEELLQDKMAETVQLQEIPEEEPLQTKRENNTGMPDNLKAGVENLSGIDMSDVRVHYNSSKPAEVGALAYTQGTNIHVSPGQERHLPHEAWHVVQQKQGRVRPTMQLKGLAVNDDVGLEKEADIMGAKVTYEPVSRRKQGSIAQGVYRVVQQNSGAVQRWPEITSQEGTFTYYLGEEFTEKHTAGNKKEAMEKARRYYNPEHREGSHNAYITVIYGNSLQSVKEAIDVNPRDGYEWALSVNVQAVCMGPRGMRGANGDPGQMDENITTVILSGYIDEQNRGKITHVSVSM